MYGVSGVVTATASTASKTLRAVGYRRVSTEGQAGERNVSLETQARRFQEYCKLKGYQPIEVFTDIASGRRDSRKEYQRMLACVRAGGADVVIVQFVDRFGRKPREMLTRIWELETRGVRVESTDEDIKEEMMLLIRAGMAGYEAKRIGERVRDNIRRRVEMGSKIGRAPYGYRGVRGTPDARGYSLVERFEQVPEEVAVLRRMYVLIVEQGYGVKRAADTLNAEGLYGRGGRSWIGPNVNAVIYNESLAGRMVYGRKRTKGAPQREPITREGAYPAIFSADEWRRLMERKAINQGFNRGNARKSHYLLSGILRCGECGGAMFGHTTTNRQGKKYQSYLCTNHRQAVATCPTARGHSQPAVERALLEYLGQFSNEAQVKRYLSASQFKDTKSNEAESARIQKRLSELETGLLNDLDRLDRGILTEDEYKLASGRRREEVGHLKAREAELSKLLESTKNANAQAKRIPVAIRDFLEDFPNLSIERRKAVLQGILKTVRIFTDGRFEIEFR